MALPRRAIRKVRRLPVCVSYCRLMKPVTVLRITTLLAAFASFVFSVWLYFANDGAVDDKLNGIFVGVWVPSILAFGLFLIQALPKRD